MNMISLKINSCEALTKVKSKDDVRSYFLPTKIVASVAPRGVALPAPRTSNHGVVQSYSNQAKHDNTARDQ